MVEPFSSTRKYAHLIPSRLRAEKLSVVTLRDDTVHVIDGQRMHPRPPAGTSEAPRYLWAIRGFLSHTTSELKNMSSLQMFKDVDQELHYSVILEESANKPSYYHIY